jgi:flavin-dependent dehydrogenase
MTPAEILAAHGPREAMEYDVVVVGGGPGGLATAIRLKQLAAEQGKEISVVVLEKGSEPGAHILSGAVMDPKALTELLPNWKELGAPLNQPVTADQVLFLSETGAFDTPSFLIPDCFHNEGNYVISLGNVVRWLAQQAEGLGVEIFPGFAATEVLYNDKGSVKGIATGNMGVDKNGELTGEFQLGMELHAKYTVFAEGARGQLGRQLIANFKLDAGKDPQSYAIGVKELWEIDPAKHQPGLVVHTAGWPMDPMTYGGGFLYHLEGNLVTLGLVVATIMNGIEQWLLPRLGIKSPPWTLRRKAADHTYLRPAADCPQIVYPKPDGKITFDRLSSVFISNTNHDEHQPAHLLLKDDRIPVELNLAKYAGPESRYCPAGVYEFVPTTDAAGKAGERLQINAQNCVHCKTCDIKDPSQNIVWVTPKGGGGPNYGAM